MVGSITNRREKRSGRSFAASSRSVAPALWPMPKISDRSSASITRHNILGEILEVIAVGGRLVAVAMAAAVERIDGVARRQFAGDLVPDLGDKAGAVQQQRGRFA